MEAAKARARRGAWARVPGNDGAMRVQVPVEVLSGPRMAPDAPAREEAPLSASRAALDAQADAHRVELVRMAQAHARELNRLCDAHAAELGRAEARAERAAAQEVAAREQLAVALAEVERLRWAKRLLRPRTSRLRERLASAKRLLHSIGRGPTHPG